MTTLVHPGSRGLLPELIDLLEAPFAPIRQAPMIRCEEFTRDGNYVLRAELPGIDPESDVEVSVNNGVLTIHGERKEEEHDRGRTEFRYGAFTRSLTLPAGANEDDVTAVYDKGILEVSVGIKEPEEAAKRIAVTKAG